MVLCARIKSPVFRCQGVSGSIIGLRKEMPIAKKKRNTTSALRKVSNFACRFFIDGVSHYQQFVTNKSSRDESTSCPFSGNIRGIIVL
jgi:hypothetical protein